MFPSRKEAWDVIANTVVGSGPFAGSCYIQYIAIEAGAFWVLRVREHVCLIKSTRVAYEDHGIMVAAVS